MTSEANDLNDAIILFLGFGTASSPRRDRARLDQEFGVDHGATHESQVLNLIAEVGELAVDWSTHSLESAGEAVRSALHGRHPDLSDVAVRALVWKFTFDWR
jgi:hypothetical protein